MPPLPGQSNVPRLTSNQWGTLRYLYKLSTTGRRATNGNDERTLRSLRRRGLVEQDPERRWMWRITDAGRKVLTR